jgi:hypothetical protein
LLTFKYNREMNVFIKIFIVLLALMLLIFIITKAYIEPWLETKIHTELENTNNSIGIEKVNIDIFSSLMELDGITFHSYDFGSIDLSGKIEALKFTGINLLKALFKREIYVDEVIISKSSFTGEKTSSDKPALSLISPISMGIGKLLFNQFDLTMENDSAGYSVKNGILEIFGLHVSKLDTLQSKLISLFDFEAEELKIVSSDKMYSWLIRGINYSATMNTLAIDSFLIKPEFKDYDFTSRFKFQKNRIEADIFNIYAQDFYLNFYSRPMVIESTFAGIGEMNMKVFRDKRKEFPHLKRPAFQDMLHDIPATIRIDSINLLKGKITLKIHEEEAKQPGTIIFNEINATIYNLINDTIYKTANPVLELKTNALLMGKARMSVQLKGKLFDRNNAFTLSGNLSALDIKDLNPILENNAFIYASGKIDGMNFSFNADNVKSTGILTMLYQGLEITVKDKRTDDTTAFRSRLFSYIANRRTLDSNPVKGEEVRVGTIDYQRDPGRSLFHYTFRSILTGIISTVTKNEKNVKRKIAD